MRIRARHDDDIEPLARLVDAARHIDRWPPHRTGATADVLRHPAPLAALVAEDDDGRAVGHVALLDGGASSVMATAAHALDTDPDALVVVARLFVSPHLRGRGVGRVLLHAATDAAAGIGRRPVLDVWTELERAIAVYEAEGWVRLGVVTFDFDSPCSGDCLHAGTSLRAFVYAAPADRRG